MTLHYPLDWPISKPRTVNRSASPFTRKGLSEVVDALGRELRLMGAAQPILSTNMGPLGASNQVLARSSLKGEDPAVALYFKRKKKDLTMTCDAYSRLDANIWAIAKTLEAMRGIERWGSAELADQAFTGFAALPAPEAREPWWTVFGIDRGSSIDTVRAEYRRQVKTAHPDAGGSNEAMWRLQQALDSFEAERELGR